MKPKTAVKLLADVFMTLALLFLMGYQFWGEMAHEWVGAGMFVLFIAHHLLNGNWHKNLLKGRYTPMRILTLCLDILVLASMLAQMVSGIILSRYVFDFLPISGGMAFARRLHILGAYWGFLLISLHLGLHWSMILGMLKKLFPIQHTNKALSAVVSAAGWLIAGYGVWAFVKRDFFTYLFLRSEFVFLDYSEAKILFYLDYLALMGLCILLAHYGAKLCRHLGKKAPSQP